MQVITWQRAHASQQIGGQAAHGVKHCSLDCAVPAPAGPELRRLSGKQQLTHDIHRAIHASAQAIQPSWTRS